MQVLVGVGDILDRYCGSRRADIKRAVAESSCRGVDPVLLAQYLVFSVEYLFEGLSGTKGVADSSIHPRQRCSKHCCMTA